MAGTEIFGEEEIKALTDVIERKMIEMRNPKGMGIPEKIAQAKMASEATIIQSMSRSPLWRRAWRPGRSGR